MLLVLSAAHAATIVVGSSGAAQFSTIQAAVSAAQSGDVVEVEPGEYAGGIDFGGRSLQLRSRDGSASTTIAGGAYVGVYLDQGERDVVIDGFRFANPGGLGVYVEGGGAVTIRNSLFEGCGGDGTYGAGLTVGTGDVTVADTVFRDNVAGWGGHVYFGAGTLTITGSTFEGGAATYGGALFINGGTVHLGGSTVSNNTASGQAGAVYLGWGAVLELADTTVSANVAAVNHGGALYLAGANTLSVDGGGLSGNQISGWEAGYHGGALAAPNGATITLRDTDVADNTAYYGGGLWGVGMNLTLDGARFARNYGYYGGAIFESYSAATSTASLWDSNTTYYSGGAIYSGGGSTWSLVGDSFDENLATYGYGGAAFLSAALLSASDTGFVENLSYYTGGALFLSSMGTETVLTAGSFDQNESRYGSAGALYAEYTSPVRAEGTSFTRNQGAGVGAVYLYGSGFTGTGLVVTGNAGGSTAGAVAVIGGGSPAAFTLTDSTLTDNTCEGDGGALDLDGLVAVELRDNQLLRNRAGDEAFGGALLLQDSGTTQVVGNQFGFNVARYGGGVYVDAPTATATWANNAFVENTAANGGGACFTGGSGQSLVNNSFLGNAATEAGGSLCVVDAGLDVRNNLFAWTSEGAAVHTWSTTAAPTFGYNDFFENTESDGGGDVGDLTAAPGTRSAPPDLIAYSRDGDLTNDNLQPLRDSALVDAGDPALLDPDGSTSDIGLTGGPLASAEDADHDGFPASTDCDDENPQVNPDAFETWYDGVNSDCRGASDFDQDGDGVDDAGHGGEDCDDTDPMATAPCAADSGGGDSGHPALDGRVGGGCGCAAGGSSAPAALGLVFGAALFARRRRA